MYNINIDAENRIVTLTQAAAKLKSAGIVIKEFDTIEKKFIEGTGEIYECELILLDVKVTNDAGEETGEKELKAFSRRKGFEQWIMEFDPEEYNFAS